MAKKPVIDGKGSEPFELFATNVSFHLFRAIDLAQQGSKSVSAMHSRELILSCFLVQVKK